MGHYCYCSLFAFAYLLHWTTVRAGGGKNFTMNELCGGHVGAQ